MGTRPPCPPDLCPSPRASTDDRSVRFVETFIGDHGTIVLQTESDLAGTPAEFSPIALSRGIADNRSVPGRGELRMDRTATGVTVPRSGRALARVARPQPRDEECGAGCQMPANGSLSGASLGGGND